MQVLFRNMGFDNFGQTILVKCALLGDAAVGKTAISQALGAFCCSTFVCNSYNLDRKDNCIVQFLMEHNFQRIIQ